MIIDLKTMCRVLGSLAALTLAVQALPFFEINPACEKFLPPAAVEKISGLQNVMLVPYNLSMGAGGTCNYALDGKTMILMLNLEQSARPQDYERYRTHRMYQDNQQEIPGLGEMAFSCGKNGNIIIALKGKTLVVLSAFRRMDPKTGMSADYYFTREQLIELAKQIFASS
jgi:hypothetical protein